jgi:coenzyme F420-reducing hydrogenase delta subunit
MYWLSGAEAEKLVKSVIDTYEKVKRIGPNPIKNMKEELINNPA